MKILLIVVSLVFTTAVLSFASPSPSAPHMPSDGVKQIKVEFSEYDGKSEKDLFEYLSSFAEKEGITLTIKNESEPISSERLNQLTQLRGVSLYWIIQFACVPDNFASYDYGVDRKHIIVTIKKKLEPDSTGQPM